MAISRALERLSSGKRINSARDDAAGLALGTRLETEVRGLGRVARNINEAFGFLQTADGLLATQIDLVQRMRELAVQSSTGTISVNERDNLNRELQILLDEFERVASDSQYNGVNLLDGSLSQMRLQVGTQRGQTIEFSLGDSRSNAIFGETRGSGAFNLASSFSGDSLWVKTGDFNGDGRTDVLRRTTANKIETWIAQGDGSFTRSSSFNYSGGQTDNADVALGDFNGDGKTDFFIGSQNPVGNGNRLYLGNGAGQFSIGTSDSSADMYGLVSADFNGDGLDDIAYSSFAGGGVFVRMGLANGSLTTAQAINLTSSSFDINFVVARSGGGDLLKTGDFNGDGISDIAVWTSGNIEVQTGNGSGGFNYYADISNSASDSANLFVGDYNEDGVDDILMSSETTGQTNYYQATGSGFAGEVLVGGGNGRESGLEVDINGDGYLDLVLGSFGLDSGQYLLGDGRGSFTRITTGTLAGELAALDYNRDGILDLLSSVGSGIYIQSTSQTSAPNFVDISTQDSSQRLLGILDNALNNLIQRRASIGAMMSRLEIAENVSMITKENLAAARSQTMDADIAQESAELTRLQILQQAQVAVLGQANFSLRLVLSLLPKY